jgi:hypothetical protein
MLILEPAMEKGFIIPGLFIDATAHMGRGVFTALSISGGTVIERSPVVVMPSSERIPLDLTRLHDYIFEWGEPGEREKQCCMALGYVAVYNHSFKSNCEYVMDLERENISIRAIRDIAAGEELFINYNGDWDNEKPVWFLPES